MKMQNTHCEEISFFLPFRYFLDVGKLLVSGGLSKSRNKCSCSSNISFKWGWEYQTPWFFVLTGHYLTLDFVIISCILNATNNTFVFDTMGRPLTLDANNLPTVACAPCTISITGDETVTIQIEQEGYIHAL